MALAELLPRCKAVYVLTTCCIALGSALLWTASHSHSDATVLANLLWKNATSRKRRGSPNRAATLVWPSPPHRAITLVWPKPILASNPARTGPPVLIVLVVGGWAWVVRVCTRAGMDLERILGGPVQPARQTLHAALLLLCVLLAGKLASESGVFTWRPWLTFNLSLHVTLWAHGT